MAIYGTALLSICLLVGVVTGKLLGKLNGVYANVRGVSWPCYVVALTPDVRLDFATRRD